MSERKSDMTKRQRAALAGAAVVLVVLVIAVCVALFGQGPGEAPANSAAATTATATTNVNEASNSAGDGASDNGASDADAEGDAAQSGRGESGSEADQSEGSSSDSQVDGADASGSSAEPADSGEDQPPAIATITVTVAIDGTNCGGSYSSQSVTVDEGSNVFDALRATGVAVSGDKSYVRAINGLAEFQGGPNSGWFYYVDGVRPNYSCGSYLLSGGESILWLYVNDWTKY